MKLRNLLLASVALAGLFSACSSEMDETINDNGAQAKEEAYVSFAIQMPNVAETRATPEIEVGSIEESKVSEVTLLFFDEAAPHNLTDIQTINNLTKTSDYVYKTGALLITKGKKLVYAFANAQPTIKAFTTNDNGAAYKTITTGIGTDLASDLSGKNEFTMSNADPATKTDIAYTTEKAATDNPINIAIERTVAKVVYTGKDFNFKIYRAGDNALVGLATLTNMTLINANKKYFYLRRVSKNADGSDPVIGGVEEDGKTYVVDPNFTQNVTDITPLYRKDNFFDMPSDTMEQNKTFYCLENTMSQNGQYYGATTGITFKAEIVFEGNQTPVTFYRYNGKLYIDVIELEKAANITEPTDTWDAAKWKLKNVDFYKNGICYYHYMIKHVDNNNPVSMGVMEFGVVRNNVYRLNVTSINEIGATTPDIKPENPDETEKAYIAVSVTVKPWTLRRNENIGL